VKIETERRKVPSRIRERKATDTTKASDGGRNRNRKRRGANVRWSEEAWSKKSRGGDTKRGTVALLDSAASTDPATRGGEIETSNTVDDGIWQCLDAEEKPWHSECGRRDAARRRDGRH
jgi:hypothetical protein